MGIYRPREDIDPGRFPSILAVGDSWRWYPGNNLLQATALHPSTKGPRRSIQIIGYNCAISAFADPARGIHFVNSRGALSSVPADYTADWAKAMHSAVSGFAELVDGRWLPALRAAGIASS